MAEHPELKAKVKNLILVAPANPARFGEAGFARHSLMNYQTYFHQLSIDLPTTLMISENDPWLSYVDALRLAQAWQLTPINLGAVGHVNVASGFGPFPELLNYLLPEKKQRSTQQKTQVNFHLKFA